jgi:hypothetical protein
MVSSSTHYLLKSTHKHIKNQMFYNKITMLKLGCYRIRGGGGTFPVPRHELSTGEIFSSIPAGENTCEFGSPYKLSPRIIRYQIQINIPSRTIDSDTIVGSRRGSRGIIHIGFKNNFI